jgi:hypothetical protein
MKGERSSSQSLASDSLAGLSRRSSVASRSLESIDTGEAAVARFQRVPWDEEPPDESSRVSEVEAVERLPGESTTAQARFGDVPWHPDEVESRAAAEREDQWAEEMKVKNFFDGMG